MIMNRQRSVEVRAKETLQRIDQDYYRSLDVHIDETTLLYRIGRLIYIKMKFAQLEEEKTKRDLQNSGF